MQEKMREMFNSKNEHGLGKRWELIACMYTILKMPPQPCAIWEVGEKATLLATDNGEAGPGGIFLGKYE